LEPTPDFLVFISFGLVSQPFFTLSTWTSAVASPSPGVRTRRLDLCSHRELMLCLKDLQGFLHKNFSELEISFSGLN
ncbi:hypothetical protein SDJN02_16462, partial [Cucurbita argyrosperma subsp. argyrosperma]